MKFAIITPIQPWMTSPEVLAVMTPLNAGYPEPQALFVGGCVRNTILGLEPGDIDIATKWAPPEVIAKLEAAGLKVIPTGIDHGTVTAISAGKPYEITTLRRDVETDGRRAVVAFSQDWAEDAQRRDFTMNTLLADGAGHIYDPTGQGLEDLAAGRVIFVGDPAQRIAEDVLRILRFFRFHALYGKGELDVAALMACREQADKIPQLSRERISQEFFKILSVDNSADILRIVFNNGILSEFIFDGYGPEMLASTKEYSLTDRLFILAACSVDNLEKMERRLIFSKVMWREILALDAVWKSGLQTTQDIKIALYKQGRKATLAALLILGKNEFIDLAKDWDIPVFPIRGADLIKQGLAEGPALGATLKRLEDQWVKSSFDDSILQ